MKFRELGTTGLKVSEICLGTMTWGQQNNQDDAFEQMDYALTQGINFFDTAEMYAVPPTAESFGKTEAIIGNWFAKNGKRKDVILASKVAGSAGHMPWVRNGNARLDRANITEALEGSLRRLQTDYIDLYQIHWPQRPVNSFGKLGFDLLQVSTRESDNMLESLEVLGDCVKAGKIRYFGLSNETPWGLMTFLKHHAANKNLPRVQSIQNAYNLLNRTFEIGLAETVMQEKTGLLAYSPLGAGTLTGKYLNGAIPKGTRWDIDSRPSRYKKPNLDAAVTGYVAVAKKHGLTPAQLAQAFVNRQPFLTANIIGATKMEQLKENIAAKDITLSDEAVRDIEAVHAGNANPCP